MRLMPFVAALVAVAACKRVEPGTRVDTRVVDYDAGGAALQGYLYWDADAKTPRPGILVVHEWWGDDEHAQHQARRAAEAGYVALALDMFGKGKVTTHPQDAQAFATEATKDPAVMMARFNAGLEQLKRDPHVDSAHIAAIGYCFGGMVVLSMAKSGAPLDAVGSFHGAIPEGPVDSGKVRARVLIMTGGADPFVPADKVEAFRKALAGAGARVEVITYPGAKHGFTNPQAGTHGMDQLAYDAPADSSSWDSLLKMLKDVWH